MDLNAVIIMLLTHSIIAKIFYGEVCTYLRNILSGWDMTISKSQTYHMWSSRIKAFLFCLENQKCSAAMQ